jgi:hypothetical protein
VAKENLQKRWIGHVHLQEIEQPMADTLEKLKKKVLVGVVGGSDYVKIQEQLGGGKSVWLSQTAFRCVICVWIADLRTVSSCWKIIRLTRQSSTAVEDRFDYVFSENGLVAFRKGEPLPVMVCSGLAFSCHYLPTRRL